MKNVIFVLVHYTYRSEIEWQFTILDFIYDWKNTVIEPDKIL